MVFVTLLQQLHLFNRYTSSTVTLLQLLHFFNCYTSSTVALLLGENNVAAAAGDTGGGSGHLGGGSDRRGHAVHHAHLDQIRLWPLRNPPAPPPLGCCGWWQ